MAALAVRRWSEIHKQRARIPVVGVRHSPWGGTTICVVSSVHPLRMVRGGVARVCHEREKEVDMCRWLAYSGSPVHLDELIYKPQNSWWCRASTPGWALRRPMETASAWVGTDPGHAGHLPQHRTCVERPQPAGALRPRGLGSRLRPHPRVHRFRRAADQLPSVPLRAMAVDAQRVHRRLPHGEARPRRLPSPRSSSPRSRDRRTRVAVLPRADVRSRGRPALSRDPCGGPRGGDRGGTALAHPIQMTVATTDGETTWAFRYSSGRSRSLFHSTDVSTFETAVPGQPSAARCPRTPGSWSRNRWGTCTGPGGRCPNPRASQCGGHEEPQPFTPVVPLGRGLRGRPDV